MTLSTLERPEVELLPERVAATIRKAIVDGSLPPGTRLVEAALVKQLGVSRVPLREAFRVLEGEGLVTIHPHRGTSISEISDAEMLELFAVRAIFEGYAAEILAGKPNEEVVARLERIIDGMKASVSGQRLENYYSLAGEFHEVLVEGCGNSILVRQYDQIKRQLRRYQAAMSRLPDSAEQSIVEHGAIVRAIRARDGQAAAQAARAHIEDLIHRYRKAGESG